MVTYGFYNSINHDRVYDATQMSEIFDGIIRDGVYQYVGNKFLVDKNGLEGFQIRVGTGRAWINHTWTKNDAPLILTLPAPPTLDNYYRADAIVIDINANVNVRENKITYVTGTEVANNPSPPYPELLDGEHKQVPLAYIVRKGAETEINAANINYVVGSNPCPYVTAPVQAVDLTAHVAAWQAAWEQWFQGPNGYVQTQARAFEAEIAAAEAAIENATGDINEDVAEFRVWIASQKSQFDGWMDDSKNDFDTWFANLHYILDGDVAGHLQNEIEDLQDRVVPIEKGGTGNTNGHIQTGYRTSSIYDEPLGLFSTSEGMYCVSSGDGSHAEGGGDYTYESYDAGIYGDRILDFDNAFDSSVTGSGSGIDISYDPDISDFEYARSTNGTQFNGGNIFGDNIFNSYYIAAVLTNETSGEILKHDIINLKAAGSKNLPFLKNTVPNYGQLSSEVEGTVNTSTRYQPGYKKDAPGCANAEGFIIYDSDKNILYKRNLPPSTGYDPIDPITIDLDVYGYGIALIDSNIAHLMAIGHITVTLTYSKNYQNKYTFNGDIETTYTVYNYPPNANQQWYELPKIWIGARQAAWSEEELTPTEYSDSPFWYMNGTTPVNSTVMVPGSMKALVSLNDDRIKITNDYGYFTKNGFTSASPYIMVKDTTDEYSLKFYYSYSINDEPDYPLVWREAGESIVVSGYPTRATGKCSHAEGNCTKAAGDYSHAEGAARANYSDDSKNPGAYGFASHIEGYSTWANGRYSHAEGSETKAIGDYSHAEGSETIAYTNFTHVEGSGTFAGDPDFSNKGYYAHAEGKDTQAIGSASHAEGINSIAKGDGSHAGAGGIAGLLGQFVHGDFGFGGNKIELTSSKAIAFSDADHDYYLNGCSFVIPSNNWLTIETNRSSQDSSARMLIVIMVDGTNIEIDAIQFLNNDTVAPRKTTIVRNTGASATAFPALDVGVASNVGRIMFLQSSAKRWVQIIRVI